jgi:hypothetical protein
MRLSVLLLACCFLARPLLGAPQKPRVIVLANVSTFSPDRPDPDAAQSLMRLLLYSHLLDIEVLVASSNLEHGERVRPELLKAAIAAYEKVRRNLLLHAADYPAPERLLRAVKSGQPFASTTKRVNDSIGRNHDTEASEAIIAAGDDPDPRPLWVCAWGGTADIAQALWKVRATRTEGEMIAFTSKFRIHAIGDQDSTGPWLRDNFPTMRIIRRDTAQRGMYRGGDAALVSDGWLKENVRTDHGVIGSNYPEYKGSDPLGPVLGVKESATVTFLSLIPNGLNEPERHELSGWGGRLEGPELRPVDSAADGAALGEADPRWASVHRWRRAVQADFAARLDWCVKRYRDANHAPEGRIAGEAVRSAKPGEALDLDATVSRDPDEHTLTYEWLIDLPPGAPHGATFTAADQGRTQLTLPADAKAGALPVLLIVRDNGTPALEGYARLTVNVAP